MMFSKIIVNTWPMWQIRLHDMVVVVGYFIKQSVLHVFSSSGYACWVIGWL